MFIAGREVLLSESLLIADNEEALINTTLGGQPLTLRIRFVTTGEKKSRFQWDTSTPGTIKFTIYDWENPLGTTLTEPVRLGEIGDGRPFGFQLAQWRVANWRRRMVRYSCKH